MDIYKKFIFFRRKEKTSSENMPEMQEQILEYRGEIACKALEEDKTEEEAAILIL